MEEEMATHSSIFVWKISWTEEPGGYSPWGSDTTELAHKSMLKKISFVYFKLKFNWAPCIFAC